MMNSTLGDALPEEMARIRDVVIPAYEACGSAGMIAVLGMKADLDRAARAMIEGDVVKMLAVYKSLKEWKL